MTLGNGSTAFACCQTVGYWENGSLAGSLFDDGSLPTGSNNDDGYPHMFEKPVEMFANPGDAPIVVNDLEWSGNTPRGGEAEFGKGCDLIAMFGFKADNLLRSLGSLNFYAASSSYGYVEITHLALSHCIVGTPIERRV